VEIKTSTVPVVFTGMLLFLILNFFLLLFHSSTLPATVRFKEVGGCRTVLFERQSHKICRPFYGFTV
jgi:hypothetical protein